MIRLSVIAISLLTSVVLLSGCLDLMGNLRRDLDDYPEDRGTVGGLHPEGGFLAQEQQDSQDRYRRVGHSERAPAGVQSPESHDANGWVSEPDRESEKRDFFRTAGGGNTTDGLAGTGDEAPAPLLPPKNRYKKGNRATRSDFVDDDPNEGSLWASDGQINYYFVKNKVRGLGDLISINVEAELIKNLRSEILRTLTPQERGAEFDDAKKRLFAAGGVMPSEAVPAPSNPTAVAGATTPAPGDANPNQSDRSPASATAQASATAKDPDKLRAEINDRKFTDADIDLSRSVDFKAGDKVMAEVVERYPNGNYRVRGHKRIAYRDGYKMVSVSAIAKGSDISEDGDLVSSSKLYEYRVEVERQ